MKAIQTTYKNGAYHATDHDGNRVRSEVDHRLSSDGNHEMAMRRFCAKMKWRGNLIVNDLGASKVWSWVEGDGRIVYSVQPGSEKVFARSGRAIVKPIAPLQ